MTATSDASRNARQERSRELRRARQTQYRARQLEADLVQVAIWVPRAREAEIYLLGEKLRAEPHLELGPLRDTLSGKLRRWR